MIDISKEEVMPIVIHSTEIKDSDAGRIQESFLYIIPTEKSLGESHTEAILLMFKT
jgi:hypothetical protein